MCTLLVTGFLGIVPDNQRARGRKLCTEYRYINSFHYFLHQFFLCTLQTELCCMQYAMSLQLRFMLACLVCAAVLRAVQGKIFAIGLLQDLRLDTCSVKMYTWYGCMCMQALTVCTRSIDKRWKKAKDFYCGSTRRLLSHMHDVTSPLVFTLFFLHC